GLRVEDGANAQQPRLVARVDERGVVVAMHVGPPVAVVRAGLFRVAGRGGEPLWGRLHQTLPVGSAVGDGGPEARRFDFDAQAGEIVQMVEADRRDRKTFAALQYDEAFGGESRERLADRAGTDAQLRGQIVDLEAFAGMQPTGEDPGANGV